jgi:phosphoglycerate dehydrogenase-like enzyme
MKLVLATNANGRYFGMLDELAAEGVQIVKAFDDDSLKREIVDADGIYGFPSAEAFKLARKLRWVQSSSAGVERLWALPELQADERVVVTNARGAHAVNMAEHVFGLILAFSRGLLVAREFQKEHRWEARLARDYCYELAEGTMGIVGYGNIGRQVAKRARGFDMRVVAVDANPGVPEDTRTEAASSPEGVWPLARLDEMLGLSDVVVISAPATPESRHMIAAAQLKKMRATAGLVVISRGALVHHGDLAEALRSRTIAWAGVDATDPEPLPADSPLWDLENCLITPHSSGHSIEKEERVIAIVRENARRLARGEPLVNVVDKQKGY